MTIIRMKIALYSKVFCRMTPKDCKNIVNKKTKAAWSPRQKQLLLVIFYLNQWDGQVSLMQVNCMLLWLHSIAKGRIGFFLFVSFNDTPFYFTVIPSLTCDKSQKTYKQSSNLKPGECTRPRIKSIPAYTTLHGSETIIP